MPTQAIVKLFKDMVATIEADKGDCEWLYGGLDIFQAELKELAEIAKIEFVKKHAAKIHWHAPENESPVALQESPVLDEVAIIVANPKAVVEFQFEEKTETPVEPPVEEVKEAAPIKKKAAKSAENNKE